MATRRGGSGQRRLAVIVALVASMTITLVGRLVYVQALDPHKPVQTAGLLHQASYVVPAPRGEIVDSRGRVLVGNTAVPEITVDGDTLAALPDGGAAVLGRLAGLLKTSAATLAREITPCSSTVGAPCWTGEPYQPVPVAVGAPTSVVLAVSEHREDYPGVAVQTLTEPNYPGGSLASNVLGYTGAVDAADEQADPSLTNADTIGRTGLQAQYDAALRGTDGTQDVEIDPQGAAVAPGGQIAPVAGDTLVTSIDANVQAVAEQSLREQIAASRAAGQPATSGSVVVMDPQTGRIIAIASYPTYDPQTFVGGISNSAYAALTSPSADDPLLDRAVDGEYAPGSTFKLITASSDVMHGEVSLTGTYPCPPYLTVDGRIKTNYDSESFGALTLAGALGYSCDTFFYAPAVAEFYADQARVAAGGKPNEYLQQMAAQFGVGRLPGVDLPAGEQAPGSYADRETRLARWQANRTQYCADAKSGFRSDPNVAERQYLTELASENCTDGWRYRAGDNADMAIGQGETTVSPLQLAVAYSALVNGGRIWDPTLGWALVNGAGHVVQTITPKVHNTVPVSHTVLDYIANSLNFRLGWAVSGAFAYIGSPYQDEIGGKTGTAQVFDKQDTSWLASWGPVSTDAQGDVRARFVIVGMIEQGGTGATAAGPMLKRIWDKLLGADGPPILPGERPTTTLPTLAATPRARTAAATSGGGAPVHGLPELAPAEPAYPPRQAARR